MKIIPLMGALMIHGVGIIWIMEGGGGDSGLMPSPAPASWDVVFKAVPPALGQDPVSFAASKPVLKTTPSQKPRPLSRRQSLDYGTKTPSSAQIMPVLLESPPPLYPVDAVQNAVTGVVILNIIVHENGAVGPVRVDKSSGSPILDRAALDAVKKWRFSKANQKTHHRVPVHFQLK